MWNFSKRLGLGNRNFLFTKLSKRTLRFGSRISTVDKLWSTEVHKWIEQIWNLKRCRQWLDIVADNVSDLVNVAPELGTGYNSFCSGNSLCNYSRLPDEKVLLDFLSLNLFFMLRILSQIVFFRKNEKHS